VIIEGKENTTLAPILALKPISQKPVFLAVTSSAREQYIKNPFVCLSVCLRITGKCPPKICPPKMCQQNFISFFQNNYFHFFWGEGGGKKRGDQKTTQNKK